MGNGSKYNSEKVLIKIHYPTYPATGGKKRNNDFIKFRTESEV